jgi:PhnB protein
MGKGTIGENVSLSLDVDTRKEADRIFKELGEGGKITMPIADTFWGSYFGMLNDRFGVQWMVSFSEKR